MASSNVCLIVFTVFLEELVFHFLKRSIVFRFNRRHAYYQLRQCILVLSTPCQYLKNSGIVFCKWTQFSKYQTSSHFLFQRIIRIITIIHSIFLVFSYIKTSFRWLSVYFLFTWASYEASQLKQPALAKLNTRVKYSLVCINVGFSLPNYWQRRHCVFNLM